MYFQFAGRMYIQQFEQSKREKEKKTEQLTQLTTKVPFTAADSIKRQQASWLIDWSTTL